MSNFMTNNEALKRIVDTLELIALKKSTIETQKANLQRLKELEDRDVEDADD